MIQFTRRGAKDLYGATMNLDDLHLLQSTDPHLSGDPAGTHRGIATLPALRSALAHARANGAWPVNAVLATGDLVHHDTGGYARFRETFQDLDVPVYCLPGNHDDGEVLAAELRQPPFVPGGAADLGDWRIVLLDSTVPGAAHGHLGEGQLAALHSALDTADGRHVLVCLHHHPIPMGSAWLDALMVDNAGRFFRVLDAHRNVRAVCFGHVHQSFEGERRGVRLLGTPSTGAQFLPHSDTFAIDTARQGAYRRLTLAASGAVDSQVIWISECDSGSRRSASSAA